MQKTNLMSREYYVFEEVILRLMDTFRLVHRLAITKQELNLRVHRPQPLSMAVLAQGQERYVQSMVVGTRRCIKGCLALTQSTHGKCRRHLDTVPQLCWPLTDRARVASDAIAAGFQEAHLDEYTLVPRS